MRWFVLVALVACREPSHPPAPAPGRAPVPARGSDAGAGSDADAAADAGGDAGLAIVDAPMKWSAERERLTLDYRRRHSDPKATDLEITPHVIVLHYTSGDSAKSTRAYFDHTRIEAERAQLARGGAVNVSAHFLVDRDGTIYRLQRETRYARHCIGLNHVAIGIENVGDEPAHPLTDAQVAADAALVRDLAARFPITHLLGHYEVMKFRGDPLFVELDPAYKNDKPDPGARFMTRVRERVADLKLHGLDR
ncbi:MAG: peptidoglycan recognition family protein [Deltaproteobacteria bacterium]